MKLETKRLIIREWRETDVDHYLTSSKDVGYNVFSIPGQFLVIDKNEAIKIIKQRILRFEQKGLGKFLVFLKGSEQFIGTCGLDYYNLDGRQEMELGYRLLLNHWGKGYATEAAEAILNYGLVNLKIPRIIAFAIPQNTQSLKIIEKLGFRFLNEFEHAGLLHKLFEVTSEDLSTLNYSNNRENNFVISLAKISGIETTFETIKRHVEHLRMLDQKGQLVLAGPFTDHPSGMVVVRARNKEEAMAIAKSDPFVSEGARSFEIRTLQIADEQNNYLGETKA